MIDGIIGNILDNFEKNEYSNRSRELRAMATLLEKAADTIDEYCHAADGRESVNAYQYKMLEKERDDLSKELDGWKEKYKDLYEDYIFVGDKVKKLELEKGDDDG